MSVSSDYRNAMFLIKFHKELLISIFLILAMSLLPGFQSVSEPNRFPAPIENPVVMLYHNFAISGVYDDFMTSQSAINEITDEIKKYLAGKNSASASEKINLRNLVKNQIVDGDFKPEELFFYFENPDNFALILLGNFSIEQIYKNLDSNNAKKTDDKLVLNLELFESLIQIMISPKRIVLCPASNSEIILARIEEEKTCLADKFNAFTRMLKVKPALAGEATIDGLTRTLASTSIRIPEEFDFLRHVRLLADEQMTKIQLFIPDDEKRTDFSESLTDSLKALNAFFDNATSFSSQLKGRSIYLETDSELELERKFSRKFAAFILQFLEKTYHNQQLAGNRETDGVNTND
ncbi:MAG: hypothetical protein PWR01_2807 [Clostridiales bacterium]|nr:hypothetical protein [Clostridiales bacterium]MDN5281734.1 hypothetical protein [Candidatus Ozemobacter sp.]